jgi:hypothetical protein
MSVRRVCAIFFVIFLLRTLGCSDDSSGGDTSGGDSSSGELDDRLVGAWRHTQAYVSGDFSAAVDDYLWLDADGSYREGGNAAAGDMGASMVTGEGEGANGAWKTADRVLYLMPAGAHEWYGVANYSVSESNLMFTFGDGEKKIWERM